MKKLSFKKSIIYFFSGILLLLSAVLISHTGIHAAEADVSLYLQAYAQSTGNDLFCVSASEIPGTFSTITEAVLASSDGDIILVYPGEYEETIDLRGKNISLIGTDSSTCIIKYDTANYSEPVINASAGMISNFTLYGYKGKHPMKEFVPSLTDPGTPVELFSYIDPNSYFTSYVIHIDDDSEYGHSLIFSNCNIISENSHCIGLGLRDHFNLCFYNCCFKASNEGAIAFIHDPDKLEKAGTDMHVSFINNVWEDYGFPYLMFLTSINYTNRVELTFQNVTAFCYATNLDVLYYPGNAYAGTDLRYLWMTPDTTPVYCVNAEYTEYLKTLQKDPPYLQPGIQYIYDDSFEGIGVGPGTVSLFYICNPYNAPGNAWAGTDIYYLSQNSFGNTVSVMNYPGNI